MMKTKSYFGLSAGGFHRIAYYEWGLERAPTVIAAHGMARNGRDFDFLADALAADGKRVACPDVVGRGVSDWLADKNGYTYAQYLADMNALIARLDVETVDWVGTSMGGLIGMMLAAQPKTPIRRLVLNDVGPFIPKAALQRLGAYVGSDPRFADLDAAEAYFREVYAPFGDLTAEQWRHLVQHGVRQTENELALHYDPGIAVVAFPKELRDVALWEIWDAIRCPVLLLRGARSDLLQAETAAGMRRRGPGAEVVEIPGCGHAPPLMDPDQIAVVQAWLAREH